MYQCGLSFVNPENMKEELKGSQWSMEDKIFSEIIREAFPNLMSQFASTFNHAVRARQMGRQPVKEMAQMEENP